MNERRYWSACAFAGRWLSASARPHALPASRSMGTGATKAVYIVCDWAGHVRYVGSTIRGADARLGQHLADVERTLEWATVWVVPLVNQTPIEDVRRIEGLIGRALGPADTRTLPATLSRIAAEQ